MELINAICWTIIVNTIIICFTICRCVNIKETNKQEIAFKYLETVYEPVEYELEDK